MLQPDYEQALARAIEAQGSIAFPRRLARLIATQVSADCTLMVGYREGGPAVYLYDNLRHRRELLFQQYLSGIYAEDPFFRALSSGLAEGVYPLRRLVAELGADPHYMAVFYQTTGWREELGLVVELGRGQWLMIFLGRLQARSFGMQEQTRLQQCLPVLAALCRQHWPQGCAEMALSPPGQPDMRARVELALDSFGQNRLTRRERQVAARLIRGLDNDAIARELGNGPGTVKNHRKHLYAKLGLDSQAALFSCFLNHLITDDVRMSER